MHELMEDRYDLRSTLLTSQVPIEKWHTIIGDPSRADAILDKLVHKRTQESRDSKRRPRSAKKTQEIQEG